jgi:(1->4)-alpha-D-glucan 1-alpha-D-glucosylmutase
VPDVYQGDELEALSLVDPDNRRPVDWDARRAALAAFADGAAPEPETLKLWLIQRVLRLRARRPDAFAGAYTPVEAGPGVCAFVRGAGEVLVVAPVRDWQGTRLDLPAELVGAWRDVLGGALRELGRRTPVAELAAPYGLALLERV